MGLRESLAKDALGCLRLRRIERQEHGKHAALALGAFSPNAAAMPRDDALNGRQSDAFAGEFFGRVHALERREQAVG